MQRMLKKCIYLYKEYINPRALFNANPVASYTYALACLTNLGTHLLTADIILYKARLLSQREGCLMRHVENRPNAKSL